jgi:hypothetical protein
MKRSWVQIPLRASVGNALLVRLLGNKLVLTAEFLCLPTGKQGQFVGCFGWFGWFIDPPIRPPNQIPQQMSTRIWTDKKGSSLRLRWNHEGKRYQLALGVKDDHIGISYAKIIAGTIERDIQCSNFDRTLDLYQNSNKRNRKPKAEEPSKITAVALFEQYAAVMIRDKDSSPGSVHRYKAIASKLRECLGDKLAHQVNDSIAKNL